MRTILLLERRDSNRTRRNRLYNRSVRFRVFWLPLSIWTFLVAVPVGSMAKHEDAVYVYDAFRGAANCAQVVAKLKRLPLRPTVILSIEQGAKFLLDRKDGEALLACVVQKLRSPSRSVKALFLQDPGFLERVEEAARRAALLGDFAGRYPGLLVGAQVDVEPHASKKWSCCSNAEQREMLSAFHELLRRVRSHLRGLPLSLVAPWWYIQTGSQLPEAAPSALFLVADEIYLMAYDAPGGPPVGGEAARVLARVRAPGLFDGRGQVHIALATYEFRSAAHLQEEMKKLQQSLASSPNFAGTAVFHATSPFNAPLVRGVSGTVTDRAGHKLSAVEIKAAGIRASSNTCGQFALRGLPDRDVLLILQKKGFRPRMLMVQPPAPGIIRELGNMVLERSL